jgi:hypothetical protein
MTRYENFPEYHVGKDLDPDEEEARGELFLHNLMALQNEHLEKTGYARLDPATEKELVRMAREWADEGIRYPDVPDIDDEEETTD